MSAAEDLPFVHLHCHTDYSLLDGCAKIDRYMQRCKELGMPALAMTDHGNLFGAINFYRACEKAGIKPLVGCEIYLVYDHTQSERPKRDRKRSDDIDDVPEDELGPENYPKHQIHHKTIIAKDFRGYQNLVKLVSDAHLNGMYYRPRTDMARLAEHAEGLIGLSGCMNGVASQKLIYNDFEGAREATATFVDIFGKENYFIELQNHGMPVQQRILPGLKKLSQEFDLPMIAANDVHYVYRDDWQPHDSLLCIQTGKLVKDEQRMRYPNREFYLKSHDEMARIFSEFDGAIENTVKLAEMVDLKINFGDDHYPIYEKPIEVAVPDDSSGFDTILEVYIREKNKVLEREGKELISLSPEQRTAHKKNGLYLFDLCKRGLKERYGIDYDVVRREFPKHLRPEAPGAGEFDPESDVYAREICDKLDYELAIIVGAGFVDYFLITWDFIDWARTQSIPVGPGRGSGAGSLISYAMKITDIDPLRFGLLFERMLSLERVSPPDFDVDFCMRRRDDVVNYVRDKYGADRVANIITYGKFGAKMIVRDLARVLDIPYAEANRVAKMVPDDLNISLEAAVEKSGELAAEINTNPTVAEIYRQGKVIEGMVRNTGKHACGIIVGDQPLTNLVPLTLQEGDLTTQYAKGPVEDLGMLKCDFLGLKTLTVLDDAQKHVRRTTNLTDFNTETIPLGDEKTFALLNSGHTTGVFQLESGGMQALCRQLGISSFEEIIALIALYRPGPMQFISQYIEGKRDRSKIQVPHPLLKELVEETYGILVYQEQVMKVAQIIAGYTLGEADILRRAMGKKIKSMMDEQKGIFVAGAERTNNIPRRQAETIFGILEKFAQYGFNKSHSAAYAMLSYRTAYLKANYPVQFMAAVLGCELGNSDKLSHTLEECQSMDLPVMGPDVNESRENFAPIVEKDGTGSIRFGLAAIKGVGEGPAHAILIEREANGPFKDFHDFASRVEGKTANKRVMENLVRTGAFDNLGEERGDLMQNLDAILREVADLQKDKESGQANMFDMFGGGPEEASGKDSDSDQFKGPKGPLMPLSEKLQAEKELLGFYVSGHPMDAFKGLSERLDTFQGEDFRKMENREAFRLCAVITGVSKKISRRDNRPWAILTVANRNMSYETCVYAESFETCGDHLEIGRCVMLEGYIQRRQDDEVSLAATKVADLVASLPTIMKELTFVISTNGDSEDFIDTLRERLMPAQGPLKVNLGFLVDSDHVVVADLASSLNWSMPMNDYRELASHPAVEDILLVASEPEIPAPRWAKRKSS